MASLAKVYAKQLRKHFRVLHANWPVGNPLELGDFGVMDGDLFVRWGNVSSMGLTFQTRTDQTGDDYKFKSADVREVKISAGATVAAGPAVTARAKLEIKFGSEQAVFFNAADCKYHSIEDYAGLGKELMTKFQASEWEERFAIVTTVLEAGATTIISSLGKQANIVIEAAADNVKSINLGDANLDLEVTSSSNVGLEVVADRGLTPLMGLSKIQPKRLLGLFRTGEEWKPLEVAAIDSLGVPHAATIEGLETTDELFFGEIRDPVEWGM